MLYTTGHIRTDKKPHPYNSKLFQSMSLFLYLHFPDQELSLHNGSHSICIRYKYLLPERYTTKLRCPDHQNCLKHNPDLSSFDCDTPRFTTAGAERELTAYVSVSLPEGFAFPVKILATPSNPLCREVRSTGRCLHHTRPAIPVPLHFHC